MGRPALLLAALVAAICPACLGGLTSAHPPPGVLRGQVHVAETGGGVPVIGAIQAHPRRVRLRFHVTVRGVTATGRRIGRVIRTDAHGRFRIVVPAGRYQLSGPLRSRASVRVRSGRTVSVLLTGYPDTVTLAL